MEYNPNGGSSSIPLNGSSTTGAPLLCSKCFQPVPYGVYTGWPAQHTTLDQCIQALASAVADVQRKVPPTPIFPSDLRRKEKRGRQPKAHTTA